MSELVLLHHNEPMTTSLAIAEGTENTHEAIMKMVRKYVESLQEFGRVGFEIEPFSTAGGIQTREVAFLNEPQATLLITFLRNSETVIRFKVALVKAFYAMRDQLRLSAPGSQQVLTGNPAHAADIAVAADRTFRSVMRAGRSAGFTLQRSLRQAQAVTLQKTGVDMFEQLGFAESEIPRAPSVDIDRDPFGVSRFAAAWLAGRLPVPCCICKSTDLYAAYRRYGVENGIAEIAAESRFHRLLDACRPGIKKTRLHWEQNGKPRCVRSVIPPDALVVCPEGQRGRFYAAAHHTFAQALEKWP